MRAWSSVVLLVLLLLLATPASAIYTFEGEENSFAARGAWSFSGGFNVYPPPEALYGEDIEGSGDTAFRLLLDSMLGRHVRLKLNAFASMALLPAMPGASELVRPYRTRYLRAVFLGEQDGRGLVSLDEAVLKLFYERLDLSLGRQPINLGSNYVFTPNDFFYPFGSAQVDREFKPGVDAARADIRLNMLSTLSLIGVLGYDEGREGRPDYDHSAFLAHAETNIEGTDLILLGGKVQYRYVGGLAVVAHVDTLGIRFEGNASVPQNDPQDWYVQAAGGVDYRWENTLHLAVEYYYHGNGASDPDQYLSRFSDPHKRVFDPFMGEHYLGVALDYEILPILIAQGVVMMNVVDLSLSINPALVYQAEEEVEFIVSASIPAGWWPTTQFPSGRPIIRSEFGSYPGNLMIQGRFYF